MKIVDFIVNPIAGEGKPRITEQYLLQYFDKKDFSLTVKYSEYKGHAKVLTEQSIEKKPDIIVACGGDGTINEVAACLVHSPIILGIIPIGSGNGLARNLRIPLNIEQAIDLIKNNSSVTIDVGKVNDSYFFSNTGIGFPAHTISNFESGKKRKLIGYLKAVVQSTFSYRSTSDCTIALNSQLQINCPFLILISNTNIMGYNFSLTRKATLNDGFLDMVVIRKLNRLKRIYLGFLILFGLEHILREYSYHLIKKTTLEFENKDSPVFFQIDGELRPITKNKIQIDIFHKSLNVIGFAD